jgi:hypothetical protein
MPRVPAAFVENNFVGGLKTEFTGLNFPENSATDTDNCIFSRVGRVTRRKGFDIEDTGVYNTLSRAGSVINTYLWKNVSGDGSITLLVMQVGDKLRFYEVSDTSTAPSNQLLSSSITLSTFTPSGSVISPITDECQFSQGNGFLFVYHPNLEPFYVSYTASSQTVSGTAITVQIRDFAGISEGVPDTQRPTTLTASHRYNLGNQGWRSGFSLTSSSSITVGTGSKTFTTNLASTVTPIVNGTNLKIYSTANHTNNMTGVVTSFSGTTLVVNVTAASGAGTLTDWNIVTNPDDILTWNDALSNFPSNADIWWRFKNSSDVFDPSTTLNNISITNSPAPKGHYIVDAFSINRSTVSGISGLTTVSTSGIRPSTGAFFTGRVFYAGVNATGYNSNIYFSQIIEGVDQFGKCYQMSDPTGEDVFDLLPSDGGVINIQGAGTILKLIAQKTALLVFATNGVWAITGSQGIGFTANDYTVAKVSEVHTLSATSFVEILETVTWWTTEGIFALTSSVQQGVQIQNLVSNTIASYFADIPTTCKSNARGYYNPVTFIVQWLFRSTESTTIEEKYEFDRILNFSTITNAFYPWSVSEADLTINGIVVLETPGGTLSINNVVRGADNVVDASGNQVVTYGFGESISTIFKYVISKPSGISYNISLGEEFKENYLDWTSLGAGIDYNSYFVTGYAIHGNAQRFFQSNYIWVYSDADDAELTTTAYYLQGIWNFATSGDSGRFTTRQRVEIDHTYYSFVKKRFKLRGRGLALQLKFASSEGLPFSLVGWSKYETGNKDI